MSYFVVERNGDGGVLRIPLPTAYETREAAIAALSAATGSGEVTLTGEVFIADLGSAIPVLVMAAAPPVAPAPEPEAGSVEVPADEAPEVESEAEPEAEPQPEAEPEPESETDVVETVAGDFIIEEAVLEAPELDEAAAEVAYTTWEPLADESPETSTLADALKRAANSLEDEGVVAPDSIIGGPALDEAPLEEAAESDVTLAEPLLPEVDTAEAGAEWPWANIESYEVPADAAETVEEPLKDDAEADAEVAEPVSVATPESEIADLVQSLAGDAPIITSAPPEGEEAYVPRPVILGDYVDAAESSVETEDPFAASEDSVAAEDVPETVADVPEVSLDGGYAPMGALDLGEYTCQDCVYANTCPKVGQVTPADCGSFQWKSE